MTTFYNVHAPLWFQTVSGYTRKCRRICKCHCFHIDFKCGYMFRGLLKLQFQKVRGQSMFLKNYLFLPSCLQPRLPVHFIWNKSSSARSKCTHHKPSWRPAAPWGGYLGVQRHEEEVRPIVQRLVKKYPKCSLPWRMLANCLFLSYESVHSINDARTCALQAIALDPEDSFAYQLLADIEVESGHYTRQLFARTGVCVARSLISEIYVLAHAPWQIWKTKWSTLWLHKYLDATPALAANRQSQLSKAKLCEAAGHLQEALNIYAKLQKEAYGDTIPPLQAAILVKMHKNTEALNVLNELVRKTPGDEMALSLGRDF